MKPNLQSQYCPRTGKRKAGVAACLGLLALCCQSSTATACAASIAWPEWTVYSSENFQDHHVPHTYPLTYLFDTDPATAWVFRGSDRPWDSPDHLLGGGRYVLHLAPKRAVTIDRLRLMNGYNKDRATFLRNNRVTHVRITLFAGGQKTIKETDLKDRAGWQTITLPRRTVTGIRIEMTAFAPGRDHDICLSELALFDDLRRIDMHLPHAVVYSDGEGEQFLPEDIVMTRTGATIATTLEDCAVWNPSGRYIAGVATNGVAWIVDSQTAHLLPNPTGNWESLLWKDDRTIELQDKERHTQRITLPQAK